MSYQWVRVRDNGAARIGRIEADRIRICEGDLFRGASPTSRTIALEGAQLLQPVQPTKVIALWNNFRALGAKLGLSDPAEPLYLIKSPGSCIGPGEAIRKPAGSAKVVFEGELGIVIGRVCKQVDEAGARDCIFGYTCGNDVTAADVLNRDASFTQWARAKGYDTFCPLGPAIATGLDPMKLEVKTLLDGQVRQHYAISDMRLSAFELVSRLSHDMTLLPGDVILCGTSIGVGSMKPDSLVEVEIAGIGKLSNRFEPAEVAA